MNNKFLLKSWKNGKELSETIKSFSALSKSHKGLKDKDTMKNAWDGVSTTLEFILKLSHSFNLTH